MRFVKNSCSAEIFMDEPLLEYKGRLASALIEKWGMVQSVPDEDSPARSKLREARPAEVVARACDIAERAVDEFQKRGWFHRVPIGL